MSFLAAIWITSLVLAAWALMSVMGLVFLRVLRARQLASRSGARTKLEAALRAIIQQPDITPKLPAEMGHFGQGFTLVALDLLTQVDGTVRDRLVELMTLNKTDARLRQGLRTLNQSKRVVAAEALRYFPGTANTNALRQALGDRDGDVRIAAAASLIALGASPALSELIVQLTKGGAMPVRLSQILRDFCAAQPEEVVAIVGQNSLHPFVRAKAVETLAATGDPRHVSAIQSLTLSRVPDLRAAALRAFTKLPNQRSRDAVAMCLRDEIWFVRAAAADAASSLGFYELVPLLVSLVDDEEWWVRFRASEALEKLDSAGRSALRDMAKTGTERQRRAAALVLSKSEAA